MWRRRFNFQSYAPDAMRPLILILLLLSTASLQAQKRIGITVDAGRTAGRLTPLWGDHHDLHILFGYDGGQAGRISYWSDPGFADAIRELQPRSMRVSIGRFEYLPHPDYTSSDTAVLRNLPTEYYRGPNTMEGADDPANYHFDYLDSLLDAVARMGAEPFLTIDYIPFTLSSNNVPRQHFLAPFDNAIRNSPPASNKVFARVVRNVIRHVRGKFKGGQDYGARYIEIWNEPDRLNGLTRFWRGDDDDLLAMYRAIADEVNADAEISGITKLGGCGFRVLDHPFFSSFFLGRIGLNKVRMDFISFHAYANTIDTLMMIWDRAEKLRDENVRGAELICTEFGREPLPPNQPEWEEIDYGILRAQAIAAMNDRGYTFAHAAPLADLSNGPDYQSGLLHVAPFRPKVTTSVYHGLNRLNRTPRRLPLLITSGSYALAGRNDAGDTIIIAYPASRPAGSGDTAQLRVNALPWERYIAKRYELTESIHLSGEHLAVRKWSVGEGATFTDTLVYAADHDGGRLVLWEIVREQASSVARGSDNGAAQEVVALPNPSAGSFSLRLRGFGQGEIALELRNLLGETLARNTAISTAQGETAMRWHSDLPPGTYLLSATQGEERASQLVVIEQ